MNPTYNSDEWFISFYLRFYIVMNESFSGMVFV